MTIAINLAKLAITWSTNFDDYSHKYTTNLYIIEEADIYIGVCVPIKRLQQLVAIMKWQNGTQWQNWANKIIVSYYFYAIFWHKYQHTQYVVSNIWVHMYSHVKKQFSQNMFRTWLQTASDRSKQASSASMRANTLCVCLWSVYAHMYVTKVSHAAQLCVQMGELKTNIRKSEK